MNKAIATICIMASINLPIIAYAACLSGGDSWHNKALVNTGTTSWYVRAHSHTGGMHLTCNNGQITNQGDDWTILMTPGMSCLLNFTTTNGHTNARFGFYKPGDPVPVGNQCVELSGCTSEHLYFEPGGDLGGVALAGGPNASITLKGSTIQNSGFNKSCT